MGYKINEVEVMTLVDFLIIANGHRIQEENEWDRSRNIIAAIMNFGGMGTSDMIQPHEIIKLSKDEADVIKPITSWEQAKRLIDKM